MRRRKSPVVGAEAAAFLGEAQQLGLPFEVALGAPALGHVVALDEDAGHLALGVADRLVDEVDVPKLGLRHAAPAQEHRHVLAREGLSRAPDLVEDIREALADHLRQCLGEAEADEVAAPDQPAVGVVGQLEDVGRSGQHGDEAGRLLEQLAQQGDLAGQLVADRLHRLRSRQNA